MSKWRLEHATDARSLNTKEARENKTQQFVADNQIVNQLIYSYKYLLIYNLHYNIQLKLKVSLFYHCTKNFLHRKRL